MARSTAETISLKSARADRKTFQEIARAQLFIARLAPIREFRVDGDASQSLQAGWQSVHETDAWGAPGINLPISHQLYRL